MAMGLLDFAYPGGEDENNKWKNFGMGLLAVGPALLESQYTPPGMPAGAAVGRGLNQGFQNMVAMQHMQSQDQMRQLQAAQLKQTMGDAEQKRQARQRLLAKLGPLYADASGEAGYRAPSMAEIARDPANFGDLYTAYPELGAKAFEQAIAPKYEKVNRNERLVRDGQVILEVEDETPSGFRRGAAGLEYIPGGPSDPSYKGAVARTEAEQTAPYKIQVAREGRTNVNVNLPSQKQRTKAEETIGELYGDVLKSDFLAPQKLAKLDRLDALLGQTYTGAAGETANDAKRAMKAAGDALGLDTSKITDQVGAAEAAKALANSMALELRNPSGGAGMPGALSDKDREFLVSMVPSLTTTGEGRRMMVATQRALIQRERDVARMMRGYATRNGGTLDEGFFDELSRWSDANPLFPRPQSPEQIKGLRRGSVFIAPDNTVRVIP